MTRLERIVLRHQIDAATRARVAALPSANGAKDVDPMLKKVFEDYDPSPNCDDLPGAWMPQCKLQPIHKRRSHA